MRNLEIGQDPRSGKTILPSPETLKKLAIAYNYSYEELMEKSGYLDPSMTDDKKRMMISRYELLNELRKQIEQCFEQMLTTNDEFAPEYKPTLLKILSRVDKEFNEDLEFDDQYTTTSAWEVITNYNSTEITQDILFELKSALNLYSNPIEINEILEGPNVTYKGKLLNMDEKKRVLDILKILFSDQN